MKTLVIVFLIALMILGAKVIFFNGKNIKNGKRGGGSSGVENGKPMPPEEEKIKETH